MSDAISKAIEAMEGAINLLDIQRARYTQRLLKESIEALQALQSGEPVAEIQEYKHWLFCDNGERDGFEWRKRQVNNGDLLSLPHGTKLYTASQPVVDVNQQLVDALRACEECLMFIHGGEPLRTDVPLKLARAALLSAGKENNNDRK